MIPLSRGFGGRTLGRLAGLALAVAACGGSQPGPGTAPTRAAGSAQATTTRRGGETGSVDADGGAARADRIGGQVEIDGVFNARHAGGLPAGHGLRVRDRLLIRSGNLATVTTQGCNQLAQLGIRSVIDLRETDGPTGVTANPDASCAVSAATYLHVEIPKLLPPTESSYLRTLEAVEPRLAEIFQQIGSPRGLPAVLHCVIGRDRANIVAALVLLAAGVSAADVVTDFTTNQDPRVRAEVQARWLQAVVDYVDQRGGIEVYLWAHGVTPGQLAAIRRALLER